MKPFRKYCSDTRICHSEGEREGGGRREVCICVISAHWKVLLAASTHAPPSPVSCKCYNYCVGQVPVGAGGVLEVGWGNLGHRLGNHCTRRRWRLCACEVNQQFCLASAPCFVSRSHCERSVRVRGNSLSLPASRSATRVVFGSPWIFFMLY